MANDELFNVDFSSLGDGEALEMSEVMSAGVEALGAATEQPGEEPPGTTISATGSEENKEEDLLDFSFTEEEEEEKENKTKTPTAQKGADDDINKDDDSEDKGPGTGGNSSPVTPFASFLQEKGFLPNLDIDEFKNAEDPMQALADAWGNEVQIMQQNLVNMFPPEMVEMAKAVAQGVPFDAMKDATAQEINYGKITEDQIKEDVTLQKKLMADSLALKGFKDAKIKTLIDTFEDSGKLEAESFDALEDMKVHYKNYQEQVKQQHAQQQQQFQKQHAQRIQSIQDTVTSKEEIIPGMKLTTKAKNDLFNNMTQIVSHDQAGNPVPYVMALRQENPLEFDMVVTYLAQTTKGFKDWSKLTSTAKSNASRELEKTLSSQSNKTGGRAKQIEDAGASGDLMSSLSKMFGQ